MSTNEWEPRSHWHMEHIDDIIYGFRDILNSKDAMFCSVPWVQSGCPIGGPASPVVCSFFLSTFESNYMENSLVSEVSRRRKCFGSVRYADDLMIWSTQWCWKCLSEIPQMVYHPSTKWDMTPRSEVSMDFLDVNIEFNKAGPLPKIRPLSLQRREMLPDFISEQVPGFARFAELMRSRVHRLSQLSLDDTTLDEALYQDINVVMSLGYPSSYLQKTLAHQADDARLAVAARRILKSIHDKGNIAWCLRDSGYMTSSLDILLPKPLNKYCF